MLKHSRILKGTYFEYLNNAELWIKIQADGTFFAEQDQHEYFSSSLDEVEEWLWEHVAQYILASQITPAQQKAYNDLANWSKEAYRRGSEVVYETLHNEMCDRVKANPMLDIEFYRAII